MVEAAAPGVHGVVEAAVEHGRRVAVLQPLCVGQHVVQPHRVVPRGDEQELGGGRPELHRRDAVLGRRVELQLRAARVPHLRRSRADRRSQAKSGGVGRSQAKSGGVGRSRAESGGVRRSRAESGGVRRSRADRRSQAKSGGVGRSRAESGGVGRSRAESGGVRAESGGVRAELGGVRQSQAESGGVRRTDGDGHTDMPCHVCQRGIQTHFSTEFDMM